MVKLSKEEIYVIERKEKGGKSYSEIARSVGLSKSRIRDIYQRGKRKQRLANLPDDPNKITFGEYAAKHLSALTYSALYKAGIRSYHDFMSASAQDFLSIYRIGVNGITEIMDMRESILESMYER